VNEFYKILKSKSGEGYIDVIVIIISAMLVIVLAVKVFPVFIAKQQLNTFVTELCRTAEIAGQIATETDSMTTELRSKTGINPNILWTASYIQGTKRVQLNEQMEVTAIAKVDIGLLGSFGSFPIELTSKAVGRSEVYWK